MAKPKHTLDEPQRATVQVALARGQLEIRTLATLQDHLTADITRQVVDILNGTSPGYELPQNESPSRSLAHKGRRTSGYRGVTKDRNKWRARITRGRAETNLGSYDVELIAAVVFQVADREYHKLGLTPQRGASLQPTACTNHQPAETSARTHQHKEPSPPMASRPSTYHLETVAEN